MASSTRTKAPQKGGRSKSGRRLPPKVKTGPDIPLLPIAVAAILVALGIGMIIYAYTNSRPPAPAPAVAGIPCDQGEHTQVHYHAALQIIHEGVLTPIPANIGIQTSPTSCLYWLHVHSASPDVIHIEAPSNDTFTLGQFFSVWNTWSKNNGMGPQPFDASHVSTFTLTPDEKLVVYVDSNDGKGPQVFTGDPKSIVFTAHMVISLEITSGTPTKPPAFDWNSATNKGL